MDYCVKLGRLLLINSSLQYLGHLIVCTLLFVFRAISSETSLSTVISSNIAREHVLDYVGCHILLKIHNGTIGTKILTLGYTWDWG
jgi:hypothetical protein